MMTSSLSSNWDVYGEVFRFHAHQLLAWAYSDIHLELRREIDEPSKTGLLADAMKYRLDYHPDTPDDYLNYSVGDQDPVSPAGQLGKDRLRLDLSLHRSGIRPRISFIIEAKRLKTSACPIGDYIGEGGMGDFISARYGGECPEGAMLALIENKDVNYWTSELRRVFSKDSAAKIPELHTSSDLSPVQILSELNGELESSHTRPNGRNDIRLFHIFLDCCPTAK